MLVLQIVLILGGIIGIIWVVNAFDQYCECHYDYSFITLLSFSLVGGSIVCIYFGNEWRLAEISNNENQFNGIALIAIGFIMANYQLYLSYKNTPVLCATVGTIMQVAVFVTLGYFGSMLLIAGLMAMLFLALTATRVAST